jgi:alpha-2-macroglobulin
MYLYTYLFDCAEQTASRVLSNLAISKILFTFKTKGLPTKKELDKNVDEAIDKLSKIQKTNGGFGYWTNISNISSYLTVHCKLNFLFLF